MKPVVYIDVLFLVNYVINYLLLLTTKKICKNSAKPWRISLGALIGSLYAVLVFFPYLTIYYTIFAKLLFSIILIAISFPITKWREFLRTILIFYVVNFMFAGAVYGIFYFTDIGPYIGAAVSNGVFYFDIPLKTLLIATGASYVIISIACRIYASKMAAGKLYDICIFYRGNSTDVHALLDTGNSLFDPISGQPVIIVEFDSIKNLFPSDIVGIFSKHKNDDINLFRMVMSDTCTGVAFRLVPFCSLGKENGMLLAFKPDRVLLEKREISEVLIGIYNKKLSKTREYKALLHSGLVC